MASQAEIREKERRVRAFLEENDLDAVLLSRHGNFAWITCGGDSYVAACSDFGAASALITRDAKFILSDSVESDRIAEEEVKGQGFTMLSHPWQEAEGRWRLLREVIGDGRCISDDGTPGTALLPDAFDEIRASLTPQEVERYRQLGADCGQIVESVTRHIEPEDTETGVAGRLMKACQELGIQPIVVFVAGDNRMDRWRHPLPKPVRTRHGAMTVLCGRRHGLIASLTRIVHFGAPSEEIRRRHEAVTAIDAALIAATRVGVAVGDVLKEGLARYAEFGFPKEWNMLHQGGPTGYFTRDYRALPEERRLVQPNQAFAWNPSITGTKSEDTILALKNGPLVISLTGDWPTITHRIGDTPLQRADILVK